MDFDVEAVRKRFPSLGGRFAFFDAPGGTQVPEEVTAAVQDAMRDASGNQGAPYATSERIGRIVDNARHEAARLLRCDVQEVFFGANTTSLEFAFSRAVGRDFVAGDEVVVTAIDHDANVAPWLELAADKGLIVRVVDISDDTTLDLDDLAAKLSPQTRIVAFPWASNAVGTITDAKRIAQMAHSVGALAWIDAVQYAPHRPMNVRDIGADVLFISAYKLCGPHLGIGFATSELLGEVRPYKARPAGGKTLGSNIETGTMPYEALAGFLAAASYLDDIGGIDAVAAWEQTLGARFVNSLPESVALHGLHGVDNRVPIFLVSLPSISAKEASHELARRELGVWSGDDYYVVGLHERLGFEDALRVGLCHYNNFEDVDRLTTALREMAEP